MGRQLKRQQSELYFVGGPLDGYAESTDTPLDEMPEVLGILISPGIVEMLTTHRLDREAPITSLAFYQQIIEDEWNFRFVGSTSPAVLEYDDQGAMRPKL